jgi:hypothetical protein
MNRILLVLALLCGSAYATVPVNSCSKNYTTSVTSVNCTIATTSANHAVLIWVQTNGAASVTYSDTLGNSSAATANCGRFGILVPCAGAKSIYYLGWCSGLQASGLWAISTGASSGSVTFTVSTGSSSNMILFVAEYGQDLLSYEKSDQGGEPTFNITTSGSNDLVVVNAVDCFGGTWTTPASGFTMEYLEPTFSANSVTDRINVTPGTYNVATTESGGIAPTQFAAVFGVGTPASTAVRHARTQY